MEGVSPSSTYHRQMLSPPRVEGALPSSLAKQVQGGQQQKGRDIGKKKMHEDDPSEGQERDFFSYGP